MLSVSHLIKFNGHNFNLIQWNQDSSSTNQNKNNNNFDSGILCVKGLPFYIHIDIVVYGPRILGVPCIKGQQDWLGIVAVS